MADHDKEEGEPRTKLEKDDEKEHFTVANCRMYEGKYPEVDDLVVVEVKSIEEMGAYVALKEYNDIEGMILLSELSRYIFTITIQQISWSSLIPKHTYLYFHFFLIYFFKENFLINI